jgi:hypothetical protein
VSAGGLGSYISWLVANSCSCKSEGVRRGKETNPHRLRIFTSRHVRSSICVRRRSSSGSKDDGLANNPNHFCVVISISQEVQLYKASDC